MVRVLVLFYLFVCFVFGLDFCEELFLVGTLALLTRPSSRTVPIMVSTIFFPAAFQVNVGGRELRTSMIEVSVPKGLGVKLGLWSRNGGGSSAF